ncbi:MAG: LysR substrate-binding domain-containing protein [Pseudomonadales bacterium]
MDNLPPLRAMQVFDTLGRCSSIAEAARRLAISAGAVSQQLKILEQSLGYNLTFKEGKRLRLNEAGKAYHRRCAQAFEQMRIAGMELENDTQQQPVRISTLPSLMSNWLMPQILTWRTEHPQLKLYLDGNHSEPNEQGLEVDFRITYSERTLHAKHAQELFTDRVIPACSPRLLEGLTLNSPEDLKQLPLISVDWLPKFISPPSWRDWFKHCGCETADIEDKGLVLSLSSLAINAALAGQGVILAQHAMIRDALASGQLVTPFTQSLALPYSYYLTWHKSSFDKPHASAVHSWLLARARAQREQLEQLCTDSEKNNHGEDK